MGRSKYNAKRTEVDGIAFHSRKEARRYQELRLLEKAGQVKEIRLQPAFILHAFMANTGEVTAIGAYRGDFEYCEWNGHAWNLTFEDVKGYDTALSKWKRKHVAAQYGITVRLT